jgi:hypothetical protein
MSSLRMSSGSEEKMISFILNTYFWHRRGNNIFWLYNIHLEKVIHCQRSRRMNVSKQARIMDVMGNEMLEVLTSSSNVSTRIG